MAERRDVLPASSAALDPDGARQAVLLQEARGVMGRAGYLLRGRAAGRQRARRAGDAVRAHDRAAAAAVRPLRAGDAGRRRQPERLAALPEVMDAAEARSGAVERAVVDEMEARLLEHRAGDVFTAVVLDHDAHGSHIAIAEPPIRAGFTPPPRRRWAPR